MWREKEGEGEREMGHRVSDYFQGRWKIDGQPRLIFRLADIPYPSEEDREGGGGGSVPRFPRFLWFSPSLHFESERVAFRRLNTRREKIIYTHRVSSLLLLLWLLSVPSSFSDSRCIYTLDAPSIFLFLFFLFLVSFSPRHLFFSLLFSSSFSSLWSRVWRKWQREWRTVLRRVKGKVVNALYWNTRRWLNVFRIKRASLSSILFFFSTPWRNYHYHQSIRCLCLILIKTKKEFQKI